MELVELTDVFAATEFNAFKAPCVKGIKIDGGAEFTRNKLDDLTDMAKRYGAKGLVWMRVTDEGVDSPVAKFLSSDEISALRSEMKAQTGDLLLLVADERPKVRHVLGLLRVELGRPPVTEGGLHFTWIVDFPLFEGLDDDGRPVAAHHLFTMPNLEDLDNLETDPLSVRAQSYDLVLNGWELGSGSVRIHRPDIQQRVFDAVGIGPEDAQRRFGFLLDAFKYGAPPHAGFAFGLDRLVAILAGEENIREVIAFPKTQSGLDLLTGAPTPIEDAQLQELRLRHLPPPK
jgi:aspartyl-tRNA synthetase